MIRVRHKTGKTERDQFFPLCSIVSFTIDPVAKRGEADLVIQLADGERTTFSDWSQVELVTSGTVFTPAESKEAT